MSLRRYRQKYTLPHKRQPPVDPFETDPFKIHSYNFHYAERPLFPIPDLQQRVNNPETSKDCGTYFYNQGYSTTSNMQASRSLDGSKSLAKLQKFQDYRKRKFFNRYDSDRFCCLSQIKENFSNLTNDSGASKIFNSYSNSGIHNKETKSFFNQNKCSLASSNTISDSPPKKNTGYKININIKGSDNKSLHENISFNIENDSIYTNLNIPFTKASKYSLGRLDKNAQLSGSDTFIINKRLSKFSTTENKQNDIRKSEKERNKELTSIYSSTKFSKPSRIIPSTATEHLSSLIPFRSNNFEKNGSGFSKHSLSSKKSSIHGVKDNLSVYDSKSSRKKSSQNNLSRTYHNMSFREIKTSEPLSSSHLRSSPTKRKGSNERLPINININVFSDNLKLMKV